MCRHFFNFIFLYNLNTLALHVGVLCCNFRKVTWRRSECIKFEFNDISLHTKKYVRFIAPLKIKRKSTWVFLNKNSF